MERNRYQSVNVDGLYMYTYYAYTALDMAILFSFRSYLGVSSEFIVGVGKGDDFVPDNIHSIMIGFHFVD